MRTDGRSAKRCSRWKEKGLTLSQFAERREAQLTAAESRGFTLPPETQGLLVLEGAKLPPNVEQHVKVLTRGSHDKYEILKALKLLDTATGEN